MTDFKFDILNAPTATQSELDRQMEQYVNADPPLSEQELAEIRKRLANQLKEKKEQPKIEEPKKEKTKKEEEKTGIVQEIPNVNSTPDTHISLDNLKRTKEGKKATWFDELFFSEENVKENLKEHYKDQDVTFKEVGALDKIWVKNKAGDVEKFTLPSGWNVGFVDKDMTWEDLHKNITSFIDVGNQNINPELDLQQKNMKADLNISLDDNNFLKEAIPDWDGNWIAMSKEGDERGKEEYKALKNALLENYGSGIPGLTFGFDEKYNKLDKVDVEYALDKVIEIKATQQKQIRNKAKHDYFLKTVDAIGADFINKEGEKKELANLNDNEKAVYHAWQELDALTQQQEDTEEYRTKIKTAKEKLAEAKQDLNFWNERAWTNDFTIIDGDGNRLDDALHGSSADQFVINKDEYEDRKQAILNNTGGRRDGIRNASNLNFQETHVNAEKGKERHKVVLNDEDAYIALALSGVKPIGSNDKGYIYDLDKATLSDHYDMIVGGDGYDMWTRYKTLHGDKIKDLDGVTVEELREQFEAGKTVESKLWKGNKFNSPDGHFGLLEHSDSQSFGAWEKGFFDQDEFADIDMSKEFKRELVDLRDEKRGLLQDRKILTDAHLMNIDPGSNTLSLSVDFDEDKPGETTFSLDFVPRVAELLYEEGGRALGFDPQVNQDLNIWSKRTANDILENVATNSATVELNEEQKERIKRTGAYQVFEATTRFGPAIAEFALIDVAIKKVGAITGVPKLLHNITKTYQHGKKGSNVSAWKIAKTIGYTGSLKSDDFAKAINKYNTSARKAGQFKNVIKANKAPFLSVQNAIHHGYHILKEEAKMKVAFEDDYKTGMGAGFWIAGNMLPRFQFGRKAMFPKTAGFLNGAMKMGRPGVAGAAGSAVAGRLEGMIEEVRGGTSYEKYLVEHYGDLGEQAQTGLVDFFTFMFAARGGGVSRQNFKSVKKLDRIEKESATMLRVLNRQKENNTGTYKKDKKAWEKKYKKYNDLNSKVTDVLNELDYNSNWENLDTRREIVERAARNGQKVFRNIEGMENVRIEVHENNKKFKNKDALAEISADRKKIFLDLENITAESLPHEIAHMTFKALFHSNPEMSRAFANQIRSAFKGRKIDTFEVKEVVDGKLVGTGRFKEMTLEEYIANEYQAFNRYEKIKDEEFVAYVVELLANGKYYSSLVNVGAFANLKQNVNRFSNQYRGKDVFKETDNKQQLINFLANFGTSIQRGALTIKQIAMFEKFGLKLVEGGEANITALYKEPIGRDGRSQSEQATSTKGIKRKTIEDIYTTKIAKLSGEEKRKAIEDFLMGKSAKKGTEAYEFEIRRQNPNASDAKIKELIENGKPRIKTEAHFDAIAMEAVNRMYPELPFAEKKALMNEIKFDPFKISKTGKDVKKRGVVDIVMDYKVGKNKDLASWVMGNLLGAPETGGFSRVHEIKNERAGKLDLEIPGLFRKSITEEQGVGIRERELGSTTQEKQVSRVKAPYKGEKIKLAKDLKVEEREVGAIKRVAGEFIEQAKLKDLTYNKIGEEILPIARPVVERLLNRDVKFYERFKENGLRDPYVQKVIKENRKDLFDLAKPLFHSIPEQMSEMTAEVTGAMKTFGNLYTPTGRRVQWSEMPVWMNLSASKKASGPFVFEKKKFFNEAELKRSFLDFIYLNPKTGKPLRTEQVNTRIEKLIDFATKSLGVQTAKDLINTSGYREMILEKEGAGASIGREKVMKLDQQRVIDKVEAQVRDALPQSIATFGILTKGQKNAINVEQRFIGLARYTDLNSKEIVDVLLREIPELSKYNLEKLKNVDLTGFKAMDLMESFMESKRAFEENFMELEVGPGGIELFSGVVTGKKGEGYTVNDAIRREAALKKGVKIEDIDLRSGAIKLRDAKIANDFLGDYMNRLTKKIGADVASLPMFQYLMGTGNVRPNFGKYEYRTKPKSEGGKLIKVENFNDIPVEFQKPMSKEVGSRLQLLDASTAQSYIKTFLEGAKNSGLKNLKDVKITDNSQFLQDWNNFVTMVEAKGLEGKALKKAINKFSNEKLSANGDYAATKKANKDLLEHISLKINEVYNDLVREGKEAYAINMTHLLYQIQTNLGKGPFRGLATHKSGTLEKGVGMEFTKTGKLKSPGKYYRSEHFFQNANLVGNNLIGTIKYHNNNAEFLKIHKTVSDMFGQAGIAKRHQLIVDANGNTVNIIERKDLGTKSPGEFNIFNDRIALEKTIDFESGKTFAEIMYPEVHKIETLKNLREMLKENPIINAKKLTKSEIIKASQIMDKAVALGRQPLATKGITKKIEGKKARGASVFDFDETVGVSENFVIATKGGKTRKIASDKWPFVGDKMVKEGWKMDFSDFNKVTKGRPGPLMQKMKNQIKKYGPDNVFILTARAKESAPAIHEWLKTQGIKIPLENITGLGNSTGQAKAMWMLEKFSEGYNDMYFVDDALPNVKAVKDVLDQLDIKSKVQQAIPTKGILNSGFNKIIEETKGIKAYKTYSEAKAALEGSKVGKKWFGTPGMEDFAGLVTYAFAGKGKRGEAHIKFFNDNLQKPFNRAYNEIHNKKQSIGNDYKALRKAMPKVRKTLDNKVDGIYTVDQAIRVHLWNKAGFEIPGLSKTDLKKLTDHVRSDAKLLEFAEGLSQITMLPEGYLKPGKNWLGENITMDMNNVVERVYRKEALTEFRENREAIFGKWDGGRIVGENMNKIEAAYGPKHREALENMLWRMENGTNRTVGADSNTNKWMNWVNDATGTIMFFNQKSAVLQTISSLNYVNGSFNNPFRAAQAFANQKQYWKDFAYIFNSSMMVQRRAGLKINIEAAELLERVGSKKGGFGRFRKYLLEKGFIPTKYADSFAIASGGATYYRNSIRKYKKQGLSTKKAEAKAWEDFMQMTEATQQSSRPDLISMQQASALGRPILAFANTPMQMFRRHKRRIQDIANRRGNTMENVASALYYGFAQTAIFSFLSNAMFAVDDESDDPKKIKHAEKQKERYVQTILDSYLRGMGTGGAAVSALKNGVLSFFRESEKYMPDYANTVIDMLNVSPPIGSKARKLYSAGKTYRYDRDIIPYMGFSIDNPATLAIANVISATTNFPTDRIVMKLKNIKDASNSDFENWQRIAMSMGISKWSMGVVDEKLEAKKESLEKMVRGKKKKDKKISQDVLKIKANKRKQEQEKKEGKTVMCAAVSKSGNRCKTKVEPGSSYCTIHAKVKQNKTGKKTQCKKVKKGGKRCKMQTSSASGYCYYHD